jgi:hypothetical protein
MAPLLLSSTATLLPFVKKNRLVRHSHLLTTTVRDRVPCHTTNGTTKCASETALVGFELETNGFQFYIVANSATMPSGNSSFHIC